MKKLHVGLMLNSFDIPKWQYDALTLLCNAGHAEVVLVIKKKEHNSKKNSFKKMFDNGFIYKVYRKYLYSKNTVLKKIRINEKIIENARILECETIKKGRFSEYFNKNDLQKIQETNLDFIIRFGFGIIKGEILNVAKYGVWSYHHDDPSIIRGGPPCFWEIFYNLPVTGCILQQLTEELDAGKVLRIDRYKTINTSYEKNLAQCYKNSSKMISLVAEYLFLNKRIEYQPLGNLSAAKLYSYPTLYDMLIFFTKTQINIVKKILNYLFVEDWCVGVIKQDISDFFETKKFNDITWIKCKERHKFYADPFIAAVDDDLSILVEENNYRKYKASVTQLNINRNNLTVTNKNVVIDESWHLSYPFILRENDLEYIIPESVRCQKLNIYELSVNNIKIKAKSIGGVKGVTACVDPTIFKFGDYYWLFSTDISDTCTNLYLYYANDFDGEFKPHPLNPVKSDICSSRPAGRIVLFDGKLIRPSQNCSTTYGGSIVFNEICELTTDKYSEKEFFEIMPDKNWNNNLGLHHIDYKDGFLVIDAKKYIAGIDVFLWKIKNKITKRF